MNQVPCHPAIRIAVVVVEVEDVVGGTVEGEAVVVDVLLVAGVKRATAVAGVVEPPMILPLHRRRRLLRQRRQRSPA